ncbi:MFS transporter [Bordetella holmesii]|nr:MFS transporter [Bordetella holmesii]AHV94155.1 sugar (and other) transporter family protein [Bordetella holmesii ATCC 51541]AIT25971.1 sugar (and other) transporter family protein [Bordetella holmesii 44057]EWM42932.1 sugar (and other) transporter family protein [Bordetella holmesii 41130]EWM46544.1 sugar (and other) transporter family protein [Bordetella holmesii 35009]EWM50707.1 sugar (and other) transporter family protein [Bordetella holmesii 70147]
MAMAGVSATVVLVAFDSTIVSTTLPRVAEALNGMALYAWVGTGYLLATAASILIFGRLGDMFGRKPLMLVSVSLVALGSIACGLSQSMGQLIAFRTLQGVGGGMMIATAFAAPADLFPDARERVRWMALVSAAFAMASGIGPVLGGAATQALGWRAAFFIAPIAAVAALFLLARYFPRIAPAHAKAGRIDWLGAFLLIVLVAAPLAAMELAFAPGDSARPKLAAGLALAALAAGCCLIPHERRVVSPIFPLRILAGAEPRLLNMAAVAVGATMFILVFYSPLLLQQVLHYSPSEAGLLLTPLVAAISLGSIINGRLFPKQAEPQRLMVFGGLLLAAGSAMVLATGEGTATWWIVAAFAVNGTALGFLLPNLTLFMQMLSDRRDVGVASALVQTTRAVGSAAGTALVGIAISHTSVLIGVRIGLTLCLALSLVTAVIAHRIKMKNVITRRS